MSPKRAKDKSAFTVTGMFTLSIRRQHIISVVVLALFVVALVLDDAKLFQLMEFCGKLLVPPA